ncbi:polysaccharide export outer membrane protein [Silicimonas algicola]|uniref:Polysaccharide export outer membrane protein n=1 Tax=Silicimonas algicola TaxID=1826607 RepID=A0A316GEM2_9RHOB|nr:polysaccharide export outer membrane protein [Silicimonas algicola]
MKSRAVLLACACAVASCTNVGPRTGDILRSSSDVVGSRESVSRADTGSDFVVVEADRNVAFTWQMYEKSRGGFFGDPGAGRVAIQSGDVLSISLVSYNEAGYVDFTRNAVAPVSSTPLPPQRVTELGTINVPPLGRIAAKGKTVPALEEFLNERLSEVLVKPSVVVELVQRNSALISIVGSVGAPGSYAYTDGDARLLELVSLAGGAAAPIDGLDVTLSRNGEVRTVALTDLYTNPALNIHVRPGDVISIEPRNHSVVVLGATGKNEEVLFDTATTPLSNVLGQIGGLENRRADPKGVFIFRPTPRRLAEMLGIDTSAYPGEEILVVYRFDLTNPKSFFTLSEFEVLDGDILYIANSRYEEIDAALDVFSNAVLRPIQIGATLSGE